MGGVAGFNVTLYVVFAVVFTPDIREMGSIGAGMSSFSGCGTGVAGSSGVSCVLGGCGLAGGSFGALATVILSSTRDGSCSSTCTMVGAVCGEARTGG